MARIPNKIIISGLNWSGSGAVFDLLKEYNKEVIPVSGGALDFAAEGGLRLIGEFEMFRSPGFIADALLGNDDYFSKGNAQRVVKRQILSFRFKTIAFLRKARRPKDLKDALKVYNQVIKTKSTLVSLLDKLESTNDLQLRMKMSKQWLDNVIQIVGASDKKAVLLDQAIHLGQHISIWPKFFDPFKLIVVYRDPRDIIAEQEKYKYLYRQQISSNDICLYGESFEDALRYRGDVMLARMKQVEVIKQNVPSQNLLVLKFEDLVHDYEIQKSRIESFLGLSAEDHILPKKYFDPLKSSKNVGVYKNCNIEIPIILKTNLMDSYEKLSRT